LHKSEQDKSEAGARMVKVLGSFAAVKDRTMRLEEVSDVCIVEGLRKRVKSEVKDGRCVDAYVCVFEFWCVWVERVGGRGGLMDVCTWKTVHSFISLYL
jgi:hypothetical protein